MRFKLRHVILSLIALTAVTSKTGLGLASEEIFTGEARFPRLIASNLEKRSFTLPDDFGAPQVRIGFFPITRIMKARRREICGQKRGALPQTPGFSEAWLRCSIDKKGPLTTLTIRGPVHYRRTVSLVIPCQVASPQSLTPFHQTLGV